MKLCTIINYDLINVTMQQKTKKLTFSFFYAHSGGISFK